MGARGPKRTPTSLNKLRGNPGKRAQNHNEPQPELGAQCPAWLHPEAKREWKRLRAELERLDLLTVVDQAAMAAYCQAYARWFDAERAIAEAAADHAETLLELARMIVVCPDDPAEKVRIIDEANRRGISYRLAEQIAAMGPDTEAARKAAYKRHGRGLTTVTSQGTVIQHPLVGISNQASKEMLRIAGEFGMTPAARTRLSTIEPPVQGELFDFLSGQKVG